MKKWYDEEYEFEIEVIGFLHGDHTERYCRNGEEVGDRYTCPDGCVMFRLTAKKLENENFFKGKFFDGPFL